MPFVRRAMAEPEPPPVVERGPIGWLRQRLFDGAVQRGADDGQTALVIVALGWPTLRFLLIDAVWNGTSRIDCLPETVGRQVGACWPFITAKFGQFMYGFYPDSEHWRVDLTYVLGVMLLVPLLIPRVPYKALNAILFFGVFPVVGLLPAGRRHVRTAARRDAAVGRTAGHAGDLVHRHHRLAAARHPAGARPALGTADRAHAVASSSSSSGAACR